MSTLVNDSNGIPTLTPTPSGAGGVGLNNAFTTISALITAANTAAANLNAALAAHAALTSAHGVAGAVVGTTDAQTLSNKTLNGATLSGPVTGRLTNLTQTAVTLTAPAGKSYTLTTKVLTSNVATLTTSVTHSILVGDTVSISAVNPFGGTYVVTAVTANTFSYAVNYTNVASSSITGSVQVVQTGNLISFQNNLGTQRAFMDCTGNLTVQNLTGLIAATAPTISANTYFGITQGMVTGLHVTDTVYFGSVHLINGSGNFDASGGQYWGNGNVGTGGGDWSTDGGNLRLHGGSLYTQSHTDVAAVPATATILFNNPFQMSEGIDLMGGWADSSSISSVISISGGNISDNLGSGTVPYQNLCVATVTFNNTLNDGDTITVYTENHPEGIPITYSAGFFSDNQGNSLAADNSNTTSIAGGLNNFFSDFPAFYSDFTISTTGNVVTVTAPANSSSNLTQTWSTNTGNIATTGMTAPTIANQANALVSFFNGNSVYSSEFTATYDGYSTVSLVATVTGPNDVSLSSSGGSTFTLTGFSGGANAMVVYADLKIIDGTTGTLSFPTPTATPANASTPQGWITIEVNGVTAYLPYYQ